MFERLIWRDDRMLLDDLVFRLELSKTDTWDLGEDCFRFYKDKGLIDQYARFWSSNKDFQAKSIFELGIWDGGSTAFWFEYFQPEKYVAIDVQKRRDSAYFQRYLASRRLAARVKTFWETDQADASALRRIVSREFSEKLDLVIDDASHTYEATKASFETLFPFLRPGGFYIIEDWSWPYYLDALGPAHHLAAATEPTELLIELLGATGSTVELIGQLTILKGFLVVERGKLDLDANRDFKIQEHIFRRPRFSRLRARLGRRVRTLLRRPRRVVTRLFQSS